MAPHLHHIPQGPSKSTRKKAIKDENLEVSNSVLQASSKSTREKAIMNRNTEKSVEVSTRSTQITIWVHLDSKVYPEDIASFA